MKFITPKEFDESRKKSTKGSIIVLDIRDADKFIAGTVPDSINIDVYSDIHLQDYEKVRQKLSALPKDKEIITLCNAGFTAQPASLILESMGYKTRVLEKGMIGWNEMKKQRM